MTIHTVAAIQMVSGNDLNKNLATARQLIEKAAIAGAKVIVLPENFAVFSARQQYSIGLKEASDERPIRSFIASLAKEHQVWIVAGTIPVAADLDSTNEGDKSKVYSACFVYDDQGLERARYNKMHLFDVDVADQQGSYRESDTFLAGDCAVVIETPFGRLGLSVCYDIRFPELFRVMFNQGVDIVAVPAAFTLKTGRAHWLPLLRARAIENQCYVIGANQGGQHSSSRETSGESVVIDGWGGVLAQRDMGEGIVVADIDLDKNKKLRQAMPCQRHIRFDTREI